MSPLDGQIRIGTWNLAQVSPQGARGRAQRELLTSDHVDLWFLTEVPTAFTMEGWQLQRSRPARSGDMSWCAVAARHELEPCASDSESLALARVRLSGVPLLAACSVLPWRASAKHWDGDPARRGVHAAAPRSSMP